MLLGQCLSLEYEISATRKPKRGSKGSKNGPKIQIIGRLGHLWAKKGKNGQKIHQNGSFGSLSRYEVGPKGAKNGQKSAKNVSVGSFLRSEVGSKKLNLGQKKSSRKK